MRFLTNGTYAKMAASLATALLRCKWIKRSAVKYAKGCVVSCFFFVVSVKLLLSCALKHYAVEQALLCTTEHKQKKFLLFRIVRVG